MFIVTSNLGAFSLAWVRSCFAMPRTPTSPTSSCNVRLHLAIVILSCSGSFVVSGGILPPKN